MSELPFMVRLMVALTPKVTLHLGNGETRTVPLEKIVNVGKERLLSSYRKAGRKRRRELQDALYGDMDR